MLFRSVSQSRYCKDNREKVINKLKERIEFSSDDEAVSEVLKDAGEDKALILLHVANKKGYNTFESVKEYAKRFRKAGILSDEDMGEIIRVARAYEKRFQILRWVEDLYVPIPRARS